LGYIVQNRRTPIALKKGATAPGNDAGKSPINLRKITFASPKKEKKGPRSRGGKKVVVSGVGPSLTQLGQVAGCSCSAGWKAKVGVASLR